MVTKVCKRCDKDLPIEEYYIGTHGWIYGSCKACHYKKTKPIRKDWVKVNKKRANKLMLKAMNAWSNRCTPGVYLMETDKGMFVGASNAIEKRMFQQKCPKQPGPLTANNAKLISYTILEEVRERDERLQRWKYWIDVLKPSLNRRRG